MSDRVCFCANMKLVWLFFILHFSHCHPIENIYIYISNGALRLMAQANEKKVHTCIFMTSVFFPSFLFVHFLYVSYFWPKTHSGLTSVRIHSIATEYSVQWRQWVYCCVIPNIDLITCLHVIWEKMRERAHTMFICVCMSEWVSVCVCIWW